MSLAHLVLLLSLVLPSPGAHRMSQNPLISYRLRADFTHRMLTVYRDGAALAVYPLLSDERPVAGARLADILPLLRPDDGAVLARLVPASVPVQEGAPLRPEDHDGDGIVDGLECPLPGGMASLVRVSW